MRKPTAALLAWPAPPCSRPPSRPSPSRPGRRPGQRSRHDPLHLRQGRGRQERLQRPVRQDLAARHGRRRRQASGDLTIITRDDGGKQWAYKGKPVYLYSKDAKAGDKSGDNFKDVARGQALIPSRPPIHARRRRSRDPRLHSQPAPLCARAGGRSAARRRSGPGHAGTRLEPLLRWQRRGELRAWMFGIMHNHFVDGLRASRRQAELTPVDELPEVPVRATQSDGWKCATWTAACGRCRPNSARCCCWSASRSCPTRTPRKSRADRHGNRLSRARERGRAAREQPRIA